MKTILWKLTALLLTAALLLPTAFASFAFAADAALPIVCVCGESEIFAVNENGEKASDYAAESVELEADIYHKVEWQNWDRTVLESGEEKKFPLADIAFVKLYLDF